LLLGISSVVIAILRTLLIHGASAALYRIDRKSDWRSAWARHLKLRSGFNVAVVALANKNARVIWALLSRGDTYRSTGRVALSSIAA
jgi:transposase